MASQPPADPNQFAFDGVFYGLSQARQGMTPAEVAKGTGMSVNQVLAHVEQGHFCEVPIGDNIQAEKEHLRIQRFSVVGWYHAVREWRKGEKIPFYQTEESKWWQAHLIEMWTKRKASK